MSDSYKSNRVDDIYAVGTAETIVRQTVTATPVQLSLGGVAAAEVASITIHNIGGAYLYHGRRADISATAYSDRVLSEEYIDVPFRAGSDAAGSIWLCRDTGVSGAIAITIRRR